MRGEENTYTPRLPEGVGLPSIRSNSPSECGNYTDAMCQSGKIPIIIVCESRTIFRYHCAADLKSSGAWNYAS